MYTWVFIALFLIVMNALCFLVWAIDKERAQRRTWRVPEQRLLFLAAFGGLGGALIGQFYFRHKLRKRSFTQALFVIAAVETVGLLLVFGNV
jgi:uncharacterized membrane protein YsdA (DUF1294 family)